MSTLYTKNQLEALIDLAEKEDNDNLRDDLLITDLMDRGRIPEGEIPDVGFDNPSARVKWTPLLAKTLLRQHGIPKPLSIPTREAAVEDHHSALLESTGDIDSYLAVLAMARDASWSPELPDTDAPLLQSTQDEELQPLPGDDDTDDLESLDAISQLSLRNDELELEVTRFKELLEKEQSLHAEDNRRWSARVTALENQLHRYKRATLVLPSTQSKHGHGSAVTPTVRANRLRRDFN